MMELFRALMDLLGVVLLVIVGFALLYSLIAIFIPFDEKRWEKEKRKWFS